MQHEAEQGFHKGSGNGSANPEVTGQAAPGLQAQPPKNEPRPAPTLVTLVAQEPFPGECWVLGIGWSDAWVDSIKIRPGATVFEVADHLRRLADQVLRRPYGEPAADPSARVELPQPRVALDGGGDIRGCAHAWTPIEANRKFWMQCTKCGAVDGSGQHE
jgi:hypothetical protein